MDREFSLTVDGTEYKIELHGNSLLVNGQPFVMGQENGTLTINGISYDVALEENRAMVDGKDYEIQAKGMSVKSPVKKPQLKKKRSAASEGSIVAVMPGAILKVLVSTGDMVEDGDVVIILEAMKMENEIHTHKAGTVKAIHVTVGDNVEKEQVLVEIE